MSKLTRKDVEHVARLAKLKLSPKEIDLYLTQLGKVVDYVSELKEVDTEGTEPTSQTTGLENVMRPDKINSSQGLSQEEALAGSEKTHNGYFKVDAILTERTDK